ncbi:uncharacterized protein CTRU02_210785 [Colletotrichum truncatum]|uniref:Uncharacterized protein n=1 Tax=Colletotrichum truncatum TaxID=5467 RepID=A0ACC3YQ46_COLTU
MLKTPASQKVIRDSSASEQFAAAIEKELGDVIATLDRLCETCPGPGGVYEDAEEKERKEKIISHTNRVTKHTRKTTKTRKAQYRQIAGTKKEESSARKEVDLTLDSDANHCEEIEDAFSMFLDEELENMQRVIFKDFGFTA